MKTNIINILKKICENVIEIMWISVLVFILLIIFWDTVEWLTRILTDNKSIYNFVGHIYYTVYNIDIIILISSILLYMYKKKLKVIVTLILIFLFLSLYSYIMRV